MELLHRIRGCLFLLLFSLLNYSLATNPPPGDFTKCDGKNLVCIVHSSAGCKNPSNTKNRYSKQDHDEIDAGCKRYMLVRAISTKDVEVEFRDDTIAKGEEVKVMAGTNTVFSCKDNKVGQGKATARDNGDSSGYPNLYCKFTLSAQQDILTVLRNFNPDEIVSSGNSVDIGGLDWSKLKFPCQWGARLFTTHRPNAPDNEEEELFAGSFDSIDGDAGRKCPAEYFLWYRSPTDPKTMKDIIINKFACYEGKISLTMKDAAGTDVSLPADLDSGTSKCARKKCGTCTCPNCVPPPPTPATTCAAEPQFTPSDGTTCAKITCPNCKGMRIESTAGSSSVHNNNSLECSAEKKWQSYADVSKVTCLEEIKCSLLKPISTVCPAKLPVGKKCEKATLNDEGGEVCKDAETWLVPKDATVPRQLGKLHCEESTGEWRGYLTDEKNTAADVRPNSTVYCLTKAAEAAPSTAAAGMSAGMMIGCILGGGVVVAIIVAVTVICLKRNLKKKGNRDEMKSVSVTGRGGNKKSRRRGKSSSTSKTSEQISAPPPPPCPDTLSFNVEPELPPRPTPPGPPSSGGSAGLPLVGPDTGKPDKPAELIDINLTSEKKTDKESKKDENATVVNTVTGTDSKAEPAKKKTENTDNTTKKEKNGDSAKSDTGKPGAKKKARKPEYNEKGELKIQLDKNGRGLTDDDDFNIDEGAKPVDHVDKNKKPYKPAIDPRKKMINVTMTEDEDGRLKPKKDRNDPLF